MEARRREARCHGGDASGQAAAWLQQYDRRVRSPAARRPCSGGGSTARGEHMCCLRGPRPGTPAVEAEALLAASACAACDERPCAGEGEQWAGGVVESYAEVGSAVDKAF